MNNFIIIGCDNYKSTKELHMIQVLVYLKFGQWKLFCDISVSPRSTEHKFGIDGTKDKGDQSCDSGTILATYLMTFSLVNAWDLSSSLQYVSNRQTSTLVNSKTNLYNLYIFIFSYYFYLETHFTRQKNKPLHKVYLVVKY